jgi:hypothetical protein
MRHSVGDKLARAEVDAEAGNNYFSGVRMITGIIRVVFF